jgi:hypothetical protein
LRSGGIGRCAFIVDASDDALDRGGLQHDHNIDVRFVPHYAAVVSDYSDQGGNDSLAAVQRE